MLVIYAFPPPFPFALINDRPIAVTYELTELGRAALDILEDLRLWSEKYDIR